MTKTLSNCIHLFYKQSVRGPLIRNTQSANRIAQEVGERRAACSNVYKIGFSCKPKGLRKSNSERKEATMQRYTRPQNISFTLWGMGTAFFCTLVVSIFLTLPDSVYTVITVVAAG